MSPTPIVGATSMPRLTPYISVPMFKNDGRRGVPIDQLVPRGDDAENEQALARYIESASGAMDSFCQQILAATLDTETRRVIVNRNGFAYVHPRYRPVIGVTAFAVGASPATVAPLASLAGTGVTPQMFAVPAYAGVLPINTSAGPLQFGNPAAMPGEAWATYTYANGYPVTQLTAPITAGATSISVADTTGIVAGLTWLTVYAGQNTARFLAGTVSTAPSGGIGTGPGTVTCAANAFAHNVPTNGPWPVMVSAMPPDAIQACVLLTRAFIKESGGANLSTPTIAANGAGGGDNGAGADIAKAYDILVKGNYVAPVE